MTPWQIGVLIACGGLCITLLCLTVGARGERARVDKEAPRYDRDGYLCVCEVRWARRDLTDLRALLTKTPTSIGEEYVREYSPRSRHAHPGE